MSVNIAVIAGDGIGKEVTAEAAKVLSAIEQRFGRQLHLEHLPWGADHYLQTGVTLPPGRLRHPPRSSTPSSSARWAIPRVPDNRHARDILLGTRFELDLYVNYRPVKLLDERLCPLKGRTPADVDFVVFRENTEGLYVSIGGRFKAGHRGRGRHPGRDQHLERRQPHRPSRVRVRAGPRTDARLHGRQEQRHDRTATRSGSASSGRSPRNSRRSRATHYYIDALAMYMVHDPSQFEVIVTNNLFGDIVTDLAATFQGGLGMAASGNIHPGRTSMFEPVHGSAPKFAGKNVANPIGAISSAALMLETLGMKEEAAAIDAAVLHAVKDNQRDAGRWWQPGHARSGDAIVRALLS